MSASANRPKAGKACWGGTNGPSKPLNSKSRAEPKNEAPSCSSFLLPPSSFFVMGATHDFCPARGGDQGTDEEVWQLPGARPSDDVGRARGNSRLHRPEWGWEDDNDQDFGRPR